MLHVSNLENSLYIREVYRSLAHLGERFARVCREAVTGRKLSSRARLVYRHAARLAVNNRSRIW